MPETNKNFVSPDWNEFANMIKREDWTMNDGVQAMKMKTVTIDPEMKMKIKMPVATPAAMKPFIYSILGTQGGEEMCW